MKRLISTIIFMSVAMAATAQTHYYSDKEYIRFQDVTYKIENDGYCYHFYDSTCVLTNKPLKKRDGSGFYGMTYAASKQDWHSFFNDVIHEVFTNEEIRKFGEEELGITYYINTDTAEIEELMFSIRHKYTILLNTLPPEKLRALELKIRAGLTFTVSEKYREILPVLIRYQTIYFSQIPSRK